MVVAPWLFYLSLALIFVLFSCLSVSLYFNYRHALLILNIIDGVEDSLDILDDRYASVSEILDIPLFYDSPQIRQVHEDVSTCREAILNVAMLIGTVDDVQVEEDAK